MNYSFDAANVAELVVGDTLTLRDNTTHVAVEDVEHYGCTKCSIAYTVGKQTACGCWQTDCMVGNFIFNKSE